MNESKNGLSAVALLQLHRICFLQCGPFNSEDVHFIPVDSTQTSLVLMTQLTDVGSFRNVLIAFTPLLNFNTGSRVGNHITQMRKMEGLRVHDRFQDLKVFNGTPVYFCTTVTLGFHRMRPPARA